jgi:predicted nuclease with TOPRIM domain
MKKVGILLHETSIINFSFVWKLVKRYYFFTIIIPIVVFSAFGYKYITQKPIYLVKLGFQNTSSSGSGSATTAIFDSLGEKSNSLTPPEVIAMAKNVDFRQEVALAIRNHPDFDKIDFNSFGGKKRVSPKEIFKKCNNNRECEIGIINSKIGGMFSFVQDNFLESRFTIDVKNIHKASALIIVKVVAKKLEERRLRQLQQFIQDQISITKDLASKKKKELDDSGVESIAEDIKQKEVLLEGITAQLRTYQTNYLRIQQQMTSAETILSQTKETLNKDVDFKKLRASRRAKLLKDKIEKLREDIASVELASNSFGKGKKVLGKLKRDLASKEKEYKDVVRTSRGASSFDSLIDAKDSSTSYTEFDFAVMKKKYADAKKRYDDLKAEKEKIIHERSELELKYQKMEPSIEYNKLLNEKLVKLELASSTVVPDLIFDTKVSSVQRYKQLSKPKVIMASLSVSGFITFTIMILFYLFDNRIYDEEELKNNFTDLKIIGNTPDFH